MEYSKLCGAKAEITLDYIDITVGQKNRPDLSFPAKSKSRVRCKNYCRQKIIRFLEFELVFEMTVLG